MVNTIVVVGAGVSGLTSALLLSRNTSSAITVVAEYMPGDRIAEYASAWAGANFVPLAAEEESQLAIRTWPELKRLATEMPEAGVHFQEIKLQRRDKDLKDASSSGFQGAFMANPWFKKLFEDFRDLEKSELSVGYDAGCAFTSVCINPNVYLPWLVGQCAKNGVVFKRVRLSDITEAKYIGHTNASADVIVNCTGLGARSLNGVNDTNMSPIRGQTVLVRNVPKAMMMFSGTENGHGEEIYVMQRALGGGTILGGTYEMGNWNPNPDPNTALRIMKRVVDTCPDVAGGKGIQGLDVISHGVGLRPFRIGGVRIEKEKLDQDTWLIHNYGHNSWGYLGSYGSSEAVLRLFDDILCESGRDSGPSTVRPQQIKSHL